MTELQAHTIKEHSTELRKVKEMFHLDNRELVRLLEDVAEVDLILTPEEITHFAVDWKIHL